MLDTLLLMYEVLQTVLTITFLFILLDRKQWGYTSVFVSISILFILLKFQLVPYELGGHLDRFLWGTYNVAFIMLFHFYCFHKTYGAALTTTSKA